MHRLPDFQYKVYKALANLKDGFIGDPDFIDLLCPALREIKDETLEQFVNIAIAPICAIKIAIIREYVFRVEKEEREEAEARESLRRLKEELQNDPTYTGIHKRDNSDIAQDDLYSSYTVQQFQDEIDFLCKRSLEAQMNGDRDEAAALSAKAADLSSRQQNLRNKIAHARTATGTQAMIEQWYNTRLKGF